MARTMAHRNSETGRAEMLTRAQARSTARLIPWSKGPTTRAQRIRRALIG